MANRKSTVREPGGDVIVTIKPGTPEMAAYLEVGYGMSLEKAETIIRERPDRPDLWPYEIFEKAQAFVAAYNASPEPVSTRPAWRLTPHPDRRKKR